MSAKNNDETIRPLIAIAHQLLDAVRNLPEAIGKEVVKQLLITNMPNTRKKKQEDILFNIGMKPVEIINQLYPNMDKSERRAKAKAISARAKR